MCIRRLAAVIFGLGFLDNVKQESEVSWLPTMTHGVFDAYGTKFNMRNHSCRCFPPKLGTFVFKLIGGHREVDRNLRFSTTISLGFSLHSYLSVCPNLRFQFALWYVCVLQTIEK